MLSIIRVAYIATRLFLFYMVLAGPPAVLLAHYGYDKSPNVNEAYQLYTGMLFVLCFLEYQRAKKAFVPFCSRLLNKWARA